MARRWTRKAGRSRVIYYFHDLSTPLMLFTVYAKNEKADLSAKDRRELRALVHLIVEQFKRRKRG